MIHVAVISLQKPLFGFCLPLVIFGLSHEQKMEPAAELLLCAFGGTLLYLNFFCVVERWLVVLVIAPGLQYSRVKIWRVGF